ncbi:MAG: virulence RhuM family protein [Planctomycetia bacterium]
MSDLILYTSDDGSTRIDLRVDGGTIWLSQGEIAELFQTTKQNVSLHSQNIFADGELTPAATVKESLTVQTEGKRTVKRTVSLYNLDLILAIGYRVRSPRGVQFRQWATTHLREFLVKGFVIDDARLKDPRGWDHFDELLARIREIRASEKRFYQKVRDLFALSSDDKATEPETALFFAETQNKLLYAATGSTAAELIVARADASSPNMALTSWKGSRVRKEDVIVAKNYLTQDEIDTLNRLTVIFLEQAELRVKDRKELSLAFWRDNVDALLRFNDRALLVGSGSVSHDDATRIAADRYDEFDEMRRLAGAAAADAEDLRQIEDLEKELKEKKADPPDE